MARILGARDAPLGPGSQVHHNLARGGHRVPGNWHQPSRSRGLGHDAVLLRTPLHVGPGEAGEVWWSSTILRHRAANWEQETSGEVRLQIGVEWSQKKIDLGSNSKVDPWRSQFCHHEFGLFSFRYINCTFICRQWKSWNQCDNFKMLMKFRNSYLYDNFQNRNLIWIELYRFKWKMWTQWQWSVSVNQDWPKRRSNDSLIHFYKRFIG